MPIDEIESAFTCDNQRYDAIENELDTIVVFDMPPCVVNSSVMNILQEILTQSQRRMSEKAWQKPIGATPQGWSRLLVTLQGTNSDDEFAVLHDHLLNCGPQAKLPFTFERMTVELAY